MNSYQKLNLKYKELNLKYKEIEEERIGLLKSEYDCVALQEILEKENEELKELIELLNNEIESLKNENKTETMYTNLVNKIKNDSKNNIYLKSILKYVEKQNG